MENNKKSIKKNVPEIKSTNDEWVCGICEVPLDRNKNFKDYMYSNKRTQEDWCDACTHKRLE